VWLDNVSDSGVAATDAVGGKPLPPPSEAAAKAQPGPAPAAKSKTPIFIGAGVAAAVVVALVAFLVTRGGDDAKVTTLADKKVTFEDDVEDIGHPTVHTVHAKGNTVVLITATSDNEDAKPGVVVLTKQETIDAVASKIEGADELLNTKLKDACSNLREEDIGAKGTAVYFARSSGDAGAQLDSFMVIPIEGDYEFVPVLVNSDGLCEAGKSTLDLEPRSVDFTDVENIDDLASVIDDDPVLSSLASG
jgi:hypothetical protein